MDFGPEIEAYADKRIGIYGGKFLPFHRGHLSYIMRAQSMVDVLFVVVHYDEVFESALCEGTKFEYVGPEVRERWLAEELKPFPNIRVISAYEHRSNDYMNDPSIWDSYRELERRIGHIDVVFSGEDSYAEYYEKYLPGAENVAFYQDRPVVDISATRIREMGVNEGWDYLPRSVQNWYVKRVAICGIESVGKTYLSNMLAKAYSTTSVPEYGRLYYEHLNAYSDVAVRADFADIAAGQVHTLNLGAREANRALIADTDLVYTAWFHMKEYGEKDPVVDALIKARAEKIDCWLYIEPRNPHVLDGTRLPVTDEHRAQNNASLKALYAEYGIELTVIDSADRGERFEAAVAAVRSVLDGKR